MSRRLRVPLLAFCCRRRRCYQDDPGRRPSTSQNLREVLLTDAPFPYTLCKRECLCVSVAPARPETTGDAGWETIAQPGRCSTAVAPAGYQALWGGQLSAVCTRIRVIIDPMQRPCGENGSDARSIGRPGKRLSRCTRRWRTAR